jgi:hypothetical protein
MKSKYKSLAEWRKADNKAYTYARLNNLLINICEKNGWELDIRYPRGYWTKERCLVQAKIFSSRKEWIENSGTSYNISRKNGWIDECTSHMIDMKKPKGYWNLERCREDALNYKTRNEWKSNSQGCYEFARQQTWYKECTSHMISKSKPNGYWTKERCIEEAKKYKRIVDWAKKGNSNSIRIAKNNGWFDECTSHMTIRKTKYGYWNKETCLGEAIKYTSRKEWASSNNDSYIAAKRRGIVEECCSHMEVDKVELEWTKERCIEEAKKYTSRKQWRDNSIVSYNISNRKNGWVDECTNHMVDVKKPNDYWTLERCKAEALKYSSRKEWRANSGGSFCRANKNGWINECCGHMIMKTKPMRYWTLERCIEEAKKYNTLTSWIKNDSGSYHAAYRNKWVKECVAHMVNKRNKKNK